MCSNAKFSYCVPVKLACLLLAAIHAVATGVLFVVCVIELEKYEVNTPDTEIFGHRNDLFKATGIWAHRFAMYIGMIVTAVISAVTSIFSVLLCIGICIRQPGFVYAYVVGGAVISCVVTVALFIHLRIIESYFITGIFGWIVLHVLYLLLVYKTHRVLKEEVASDDHIRLKESGDMDTRHKSDQKHPNL